MGWKVSRYTHCLPNARHGGVLYNGRTGAVAEFSPGAFRKVLELAERLGSGPDGAEQPGPRQLMGHLIAGGFVVRAETDEVALLEETYERERARSPFLLTIIPTYSCNLGCSYCFVRTKVGTMADRVQAQLVRFVSEYLDAHAVPSMGVDWFGGEPLLAVETIRSLSAEFRRLCRRRDVPYDAQVITNGTRLTAQVVRDLRDSGVSRLQVTLDGPRDVHDARRGFKCGLGSSFDAILEGLGLAVGKFQIRLRINVDSRNLDQAWLLLNVFEERGWLGPGTQFFPYLARVSPFTEVCSEVTGYACDTDTFQAAQMRWITRLHELGVPTRLQPLYQFPQPRAYSCAAVGANGFIVTPQGEIQKCGLAADDPAQAVGRIDEPMDPGHPNQRRWREYSPFRDPVCRACPYLPTCLGGCPRDRIDGRAAQVRDTCVYFQKYEESSLLVHLGLASEGARTDGRRMAPRP